MCGIASFFSYTPNGAPVDTEDLLRICDELLAVPV